MKLESPHLAKNQFTLTVFFVLMIFVFGMVVEIWAGPPPGQGRRHPSRAFQGHHGQGFMGKGICPQIRTTVQAPDTISKQRNPLKKALIFFMPVNHCFRLKCSLLHVKSVTVLRGTDWELWRKA